MSRLYKLAATTTLIWLVLQPIWLYLVSPPYGKLLAGAANIMIRHNFVTGDETVYEYVHPCIKGNIHFDVVDARDGRPGRGNLRFTMDGERFQFNLTIWLALALATPFGGARLKQLRFLLVGWLVVFLFQELDLLLQTADDKLTYMQSGAFLAQFRPHRAIDYVLGSLGKYFLLVGYAVVPILVWLPVGVRQLHRTQDARREIDAEAPQRERASEIKEN